jgi:2-polyprenyl-3-methyl-5-hydroxy-6-metoxy-1,4-benzoquinol methylase
MYDTHKRLEVVFNELLTEEIKGKKLLDAGCGTGWFSKWACDRNAQVTSMDLGYKLLREVAKKCNSNRIVGSILEIPFKDNTFEFIISSEVIEHTPNPYLAMHELYRVLKPDGTLILTTPNKLWHIFVIIANKLRLRPYRGLENWVSRFEIKRNLNIIGFKIENLVGIHLFPFLIPMSYPILDFFNKYNKKLGFLMVNIAVKCKK